MTKYFHNLEIITLLVITIFGIIQGQVTVFYIIYLFWFQELLRTLIDLTYILINKKTIQDKIGTVRLSTSNFFLLFIYFVFIVVLFGFMVNWGDSDKIRQNAMVVLFRNWFFNTNLLIFALEYIYFRNQIDNTNLELKSFNRRHIILHISIILGAIIQMIIAPRLHLDKNYIPALTVLPFLLLKILIDKPIFPEHARLIRKIRK